ncbi:hypothetical protein SAMN05421819_3661 [Bryocella elongata]|uniref:Uncharacterized protein n=1 Tax=Bryocella elongata TaxID=863522 RepID=A0A1H6BF24_9BACT|nr:hypothetical protein SAMN05421819_3661 [Bryocella elongata]
MHHPLLILGLTLTSALTAALVSVRPNPSPGPQQRHQAE